MSAFDIRDALLGRDYVTGNTQIWIDDEIFYRIEAVEHKIASAAKGDVAALEGELEALWKERDETAYTVHLRAISNRSHEDIMSKALAAWPIKRDAFGREDDALVLERGKLMREMQFAAHLTKIVNPEGVAMEVNDDNRRDVARTILAEAPRITINVIDQAIAQLNRDFQSQQHSQQDTDFLSKR